MNKKRKNALGISLIVTVMIITGISLKYFSREKGTLYNLEMSKNLDNTTFGTVYVYRYNPSKKQVESQAYSNLEAKNTKILNYLNEFEFTEVKDWEEDNKGIKIMYFFSSPNANVQLTISIPNEKYISVYVYNSDTKKQYERKTYKIDNGSIDSKHLEELLE